ncbi:MAG TPA: PQQ-binding-like beta-propeller repeat protein [Acidobacteriota bacterium]|nr:PQQ-binding-like beta-propeller repeat protein [Acidobacteriota bacterium]
MLARMLLLLSLVPGWAAPQDVEALHAAVRDGAAERVRALLDAGVPVDAANEYGTTALFFAADRGDVALVRLLLERGADADRDDSFYGATPLVWALSNDHSEVAVLLLRHGSSGAVEALASAIQNDDADLLTAALDTGPLASAERDRLLTLAESLGRSNAVDALRATAVFDPELSTGFDVTPERLASYVGMYRNEDEDIMLDIVVRGSALAIHTIDGSNAGDGGETVVDAVAPDMFESADGTATLSFGGRAGVIEFAQLRHGNEDLGLQPVDPEEAELLRGNRQPRASASGAARTGDPPPRSLGQWASFRGPRASGVADGQAPPLTWNVDTGTNIRWKTPLPGIANSSPIVWDDRVFLTTAVNTTGDDIVRTGLYGDVKPVDDLSEHAFKVYCLDRITGRVLWEDLTYEGLPRIKRHPKASQANSTPVTDGEHVVVLFGSVGKLVAYTMEGHRAWERDLGALDSGWFYDPDYQWGHASSPVLYEDTVIVQVDVQQQSYLAAFDIATGEPLWKTERDEISTWGSPALYRGRPRDELITNGTTIRGYDPRTGEELWTLGPNSEVVVATPIVGDGLVYVTVGYPPVRPIYAIRPGGNGDISLPANSDTNEDIAWSKNRGGTYIPSPILYRGIFYTNANNGRLTAYDALTGEMLYRTRIAGVGSSYVASPVAADGRMYFSSEDGTVHVASVGGEFEMLASNAMNEVIWATPAISDGMLIVRTLGHVWGIGE